MRFKTCLDEDPEQPERRSSTYANEDPDHVWTKIHSNFDEDRARFETMIQNGNVDEDPTHVWTRIENDFEHTQDVWTRIQDNFDEDQQQ